MITCLILSFLPAPVQDALPVLAPFVADAPNAVTPTAGASSPEGTPGFAALDAELTSLATSVVEDDREGPRLSGFFRIYHETSHGPAFVAGVDPESEGVRPRNLQLHVSGRHGKTEYRISVEAFTGTYQLFDTFLRTPLSDDVTLTVGNFRSPLLAISRTIASEELFSRRSQQSATWVQRNFGAELWVDLGDRTRLTLAATNGGDGTADELLVAGRVDHQLVGDTKALPGARSTDAPTNWWIGAAWGDEGSIDDGEVLALETAVAWDRWWAGLEVVDYGSGFTPGSVVSGNASRASGQADATPWSLSLAMAIDDEWELVSRYEDFDRQDIWIGNLGVNWRPRPGLRWNLHAYHQEASGGGPEGDRVDLGVVLSF